MADLRLNGVIRALEAGRPAFTCFQPAEIDSAYAIQSTKFDGVVWEMEHNPWDGKALRDAMQYLLNRGQIVKARQPRAGGDADGAHPGERRREGAVAGQAGARPWLLRRSCFRTSRPWKRPTTRSRRAAIRALKREELRAPGIRGDGPHGAVRYWGLSQQEYYAKADVWPLDPNGEIFCILQIEDMRGVENLDAMLKEVKGIGAILIGEGDFGQELGIPRQYEHPEAAQADEARGRHLQEAQCRSSAIRMWKPATASASSARAIAS